MMKTIERTPSYIVLGFIVILMAASGSASAFAETSDGVSGVGNTTDITIQLELTRQAGLQVLRDVSSFDLDESIRDVEAKDLYRACRDTMYRGAVSSQFEIVNEIPDGSGFHALARRNTTSQIQISRRELDRLSEAGTLSGGLLLSVFLHEVTHDCKVGPKPVNDGFDPLINRMVQGLLKAAHRANDGSFKDLEFVAKVKAGETVTFSDLSPGVRRALTEAYINYLGDWIYENLKGKFLYRPAPAADFYASEEASVYPGWAFVKSAMTESRPDVDALVFGVMRASFEEKNLSVYHGVHRNPLPTRLVCKEKFDAVENLSFADCDLFVSWKTLPLSLQTSQLQQAIQLVRFEVDALSRASVTRIDFGHFPQSGQQMEMH